MRSDAGQRAGWGLKLAAGLGLAFLLLPLLLIFVYAFTTEEKSFAWPPPGLTLKWFGVALGRGRHLAGADAVAAGGGDLDAAGADPRHALRRGGVGREVLRARGGDAAGHPADRAAGHHHRHRAALGVQPARYSVQLLDHRSGPRDVLHRGGLQQCGGALPPHLRLADRGVDGSRRRQASRPSATSSCPISARRCWPAACWPSR